MSRTLLLLNAPQGCHVPWVAPAGVLNPYNVMGTRKVYWGRRRCRAGAGWRIIAVHPPAVVRLGQVSASKDFPDGPKTFPEDW